MASKRSSNVNVESGESSPGCPGSLGGSGFSPPTGSRTMNLLVLSVSLSGQSDAGRGEKVLVVDSLTFKGSSVVSHSNEGKKHTFNSVLKQSH